MAKKLRVLTDPDFTTKGSLLTKEEADQDLIEIWDATLDGKGVTATAAELNVLDGAGITTTELQQVANIDAVTINNTQWGYVGAMDQGVATTDAVTFNGVTSNGVLDVNANVALHDSATDISTDTFTSGFAGSGLAFLNDSGWMGTLDNLTVRQRLRVYELLINQIRASNGDVVISSASKPETVTQQGQLDWTSTDAFWTETDQYWHDTYKVVIEENKFVPFNVDDLVRAQRFTGSGTHVIKGTVVEVENGAATVTDNSTTRYFVMQVTSDSDTPTAGMDFIRWGSLSDADRQGLLYLSSDDDDAPFMDILYGLDSHSAFGTADVLKGRIGRLDGVTDANFSDLDGTQTNLFGVYLDGNIYINDGNFRGTVTVTDVSASNVTSKTDGVAVIEQASEPTTRASGDTLQNGDIWIDTDDSNKRYEYNGTSFVRDYTLIDGSSIEANTVTADKINVTNLQAVNANTGDLSVDGTLTMGSGGVITNSGQGYSVSSEGFVLEASATSTGGKLRWVSGSTVPPLGTIEAQMFVSPGATPYPFFEAQIPDDAEFRVQGTGGFFNLRRFNATSFTSVSGANDTRTISDDSVLKIGNLKASIGTIHVCGADSNHAVFTDGAGFFSSTRSGVIVDKMYDSGSTWDAGTGTPTGTTGTDGNVTLFVNSSKEIYIENRSGAELDFTFLIST